MRKLTMMFTAAALAATLAGCATPQLSPQQQAAQQEKLLAAAGFNAVPANSPQKMAELQKLPPYQVLMRFHNSKPVYVYADPAFCQCLYTGNEPAYQNYRRLAIEQNIANEQYMAAQMNENAAMNWGVWGPLW
ncbi:MAG TPA: hypothetical protein PKI41_01820 [Candidatus Competibacteraceae bacterium]|nr:hypothetical protein [Candidatus Competibacteraceae bacterium]HQA25145.1 hypothetical protein [Candidatus Competibacteraceae bacterium]HQD55144.1 hypothetical protein [Candidatus Competibacteraceae bacterium]